MLGDLVVKRPQRTRFTGVTSATTEALTTIRFALPRPGCDRELAPTAAAALTTAGLQPLLRPSAAALRSAIVALLLCASSSASADPSEVPPQLGWNYGETDTARSAGMSGALRAIGGGVTAPFMNPANLGLQRVYHIEAIGQFTPEAARHMYGGVIMDSTRRFAGAVSFVGGFQDPEGVDRSSIDVRLALAFAISEQFHVGIGGRYLNLEQQGLGPLGSSRASGGLADPEDPPLGRNALVNTGTLDAGITIRATDQLHIGVVGQNLTYPDNGLLPTTVGGGIAFGTDDFSIEVDGLADFNSWEGPSPRVMVGGEYLIAGIVPARLGYRFDYMNGDDAGSHQLSAGTGYIDTHFAVQAGVRRTVTSPHETVIVLGLAIYLDAFGLPVEEY
jgi:hypothetical protein